MGQYLYPIIIKREPQEVRYDREIELDDELLTLADLRRHVSENEYFSVSREEVSTFHFKTKLTVSSKRLETQDELDARVNKEVKYMENYNKFHDQKRQRSNNARNNESGT